MPSVCHTYPSNSRDEWPLEELSFQFNFTGCGLNTPQIAAGAKDLYDSYKKYSDLMPGTKPNMSKKSDSIVDAINAEPTSSSVTSARSRAANREAMYGTQKAETSAPSTQAKKAEPIVAVKKTQTVAMSKPKGPSEAARRAADWAEFSKGREADTAALKDITDRYAKTGSLVNPEDENAYTKSVAGEDSEYKRGGQIKRRPPKPAKKAPAKRFASGGMSRSSASKRGDGCATKGHTKGKYL